MVEEPPTAPLLAPALEVPEGFDTLSDDLVLRACLRVPFMTHGSLHAVCHRFKSLLRSDDFRKQRLEYGLAEYGVVVAGGNRDRRPTDDGWMVSEGRWREIPPMSVPRGSACSVIIDNEMWVMGGRDEYDALGDEYEDEYDDLDLAAVEVYSPKTNSWRSCTPMNQRRAGAVAGVVGGRLVVAGGKCDGRRLSSVEAYTGTGWTPLPPMPHATYLATACVLNGRLYVIGGVDRNRPRLQVLEMTEENGLSWSCKADLPAARCGAASCVHEGRIWVMGGCDGIGDMQQILHTVTASVLIYDAEAGAWGAGPPLPSRSSFGSATTTEGAIVLFDSDRMFEYKDAAWSVVDAEEEFVYSAICGSVLLG